MLNKGLRDEESIRIENTLRTLHALTFVPKFWNLEDTSLIDEQLKSFGLSLGRTIEIPEEDLYLRHSKTLEQKLTHAKFVACFLF